MSSFELYTATTKDLDELLRLEHEVEKTMPAPEAFVSDERPFYEHILAGNGNILLARDEHGDLAGASVIRYPQIDDKEHLGYAVNMPRPMMERVRHLEAIFIRQEYRGKGLSEHLLKENMRLTENVGRDIYMTMIWPLNVRSLKLHLKQGMLIRGFAIKYSGYPRFVLLGMPKQQILRRHVEYAALSDFNRHRFLLARGMAGTSVSEESVLYIAANPIASAADARS